MATAIGVGGLIGLPSPASAAGTDRCDASALSLSLLGAGAIDPIHANPGGAPCVSDNVSVLSVPLPGAISVGAVSAATQRTPNDAAVSRAQITGLRVPVTGLLGSSQLTTIADALLADPNGIVGGLVTQITGVLDGIPLLSKVTGVLGLQSLNSNGVVAALTDTLPGALRAGLLSAVPNVIAADVTEATASAECVDGRPQISGRTHYANLTALGQSIDPDSALDGPLSIDTKAIQLGALLTVDDVLAGIKIDPSGSLVSGLLRVLLGNYTSLAELLDADGVAQTTLNVVLGLPPFNTSLSALRQAITTPLQNALDTITITIPPGLLHATVIPQSQTSGGGQLTQGAISLSVSALNQPLLSGTLAQARVGADAPGCLPPAAPVPDPPPKAPVVPTPDAKPPEAPKTPTPDVRVVQNPAKYSSPEAEAVLQCAKAPTTLIDVYGAGRRTYVQGVAERRYVGQRATIYLRHGKKRVGTAKIGEDGLFSTKVPLPPRRIRTTNQARYYAVVGHRRTRALKFSRRMLTTSLTARHGTVRLRGQVTAPRRRKQARIVVKQRVSCTSYKTVTTVKPNRRGRFSATIKAPADLGAAIYRAQTKVPRERTAKHDFRTYTLPRVVGL